MSGGVEHQAPAGDEPGHKDLESETTPLLGGRGKEELPIDFTFGLSKFLNELSENFGWKQLVMMFFAQHLLKGFTFYFQSRAQPYLLEEYNMPAPYVQLIKSIVMLPWVMKPVMGMMSDLVPICHYKKTPYMIACSIIGVCALLYIGSMPSVNYGVEAEFTILTLSILLVNVQIGFVDLLSEAKYTEKMATKRTKGTSLATFVQFGNTAGSFVAIVLSGLALDHIGPKRMYLVAAVPASLVLIPLALGYMEEKFITADDLKIIRKRYWDQAELFALAGVNLMGSIYLLIIALVAKSPFFSAASSIFVGFMVAITCGMVLSPVLAKFTIFVLVTSATNWTLSGASFYFYTDTETAYPDGPHFSPFFYNSVLGGFGSIVTLFGTIAFQRYMKTWKFRNVFIGTNVILVFFGLVDAAVFARLNRRLGIPDQIAVVGSSMFESVLNQFVWMVRVILYSSLCPAGMEATMFALLASCNNLGGTIADSCGSWLLASLSIDPQGAVGDAGEFNHLWVAAIISNTLPVVMVLLLIQLVPDARPGDVIEGTGEPTEGSLFRQLMLWLHDHPQ